ncbi:hypothetical protein LSH36_123g04030 [Paralvinella palmiformis]|uniref:Uncharacterized protein n=1 Tax=Paralvinella palmiformis TaxID=53620 RepID=A0AAD9JX36_9ANNE|nr:hypothetical protein LSH36_123g04030 [Paralvinella palmiformis]
MTRRRCRVFGIGVIRSISRADEFRTLYSGVISVLGRSYKRALPRNGSRLGHMTEDDSLRAHVHRRRYEPDSNTQRRSWWGSVPTTEPSEPHPPPPAIVMTLKLKLIGCADLVNPTGAYMERKGDSLIISCNNTQETWHLVCKGNTWIGDYRNCTSAHNKMAVGDVGREEEGFPLGLLVAIAIGVVVGVVLGFVFLIGIFICRRRNRQDMKQDSGNPLMSGHGLDPDQQNIYRLVEVRPPPPMMCECHLAADPKAIPAMDNKVGIPANPGEYLYGTTPTIELADLDYPAPDVDSRQGQIAQPLKPCDIISDIHVTDGVRCCSNGRDCYGIGRNLRSQTDTYPRIKPLPPYSADRRLSSRLARVPGEVKDGTDTPIYEARQ